jgi:nucleotide-binding universal stress UspA family protein
LRGSPAYASVERHLQDAKNALESFGKEIKEQYCGCRTEFRIGMPREEIIKAAEGLGIDLLVISSHSHQWFRRLAYGSNKEELLRRVPCPVLLAREDKHGSWSLN